MIKISKEGLTKVMIKVKNAGTYLRTCQNSMIELCFENR